MSRKIDRTTIITDASHCPETLAGGWAAWITINIGDEVARLRRSGAFKNQAPSAHVAEIWALENGIHIARKACAPNILAQSDCLGALAAMRKKYSPLINFRHVPGHKANTNARQWVNNWCDREARRHMKTQRTILQHGPNQTGS